MSKNDQKNASYWLGQNQIEEGQKVDVYALASYKRSIANFIEILTGRDDIKVIFKVKGDSYTDGKQVVIGSEISDKFFDSVVGLALHEAAHIKRTNFVLWNSLSKRIPTDIRCLAQNKDLPIEATDTYVRKMWNWIEDRYIDAWVCRNAPGYKGYYDSLYNRFWHSDRITNALKRKDIFIEPKLSSYSFRIINLSNPNSILEVLPGLKEINNLSNLPDVLRLSTTMDRLNIALDISRIVFNNIDSLKKVASYNPPSTALPGKGTSGNPQGEEEDEDGDIEEPGDPDEVAESDSKPQPKEPLEDPELDEDHENAKDGIEPEDKDKEPEKKQEEESKEKTEKDGDGSAKSDKKEDEFKGGTSGDKKKEEDSSEEGLKPSPDDLSKEEEKLKKEIEKQEKFLSGDIDKKEISPELSAELDIIELSGVSKVDLTSQKIQKGAKCILVKKMTKKYVQSLQFQFKAHMNNVPKNEKSIENGIRLGTILGKKLQIRGETRSLKYIRQRTGRIEKRLIHELGFENESIFEKTFIDKYKDVELHISLDLSTSMVGEKWDKTLTCVTAICKAMSMISNVKVTVSMRAGFHEPYIVIAYDSKKDKFCKIPQLFKFIFPCGGTPEGLAFEALIDLIPTSSTSVDSYFVNFSDGEPCFGLTPVNCRGGGIFGFLDMNVSYAGPVAYDHTRHQIFRLTQKNVKVISYYISDRVEAHMNNARNVLAPLQKKRKMLLDDDDDNKNTSGKSSIVGTTMFLAGQGDRGAFTAMYGKNARFINVTNILEVAETLNKKFLEK